MRSQSRQLPTGDLTFVFTDIEGSTELLRRLGDDYPAVLLGHRRILRQAWEGHGGHELGGEGDSFFVAFTDPNEAVDACVEAQQALALNEWPDSCRVRVRIGIHSGWARPFGDEYISLVVHQAARVMSAASGDQVLATANVVVRLSAGRSLQAVRLGRCKIRDFDRPVELFSLGTDPIIDLRNVPSGSRLELATA